MISAHFSMPFTAVQRDMIVEFMVGLVNQIAGDQEGQDIRQRHGVQHTVQSENRGSQVSHGLSYQKLGKELMTQDELAVMDGGKCIFMLRGVRPFLSDKYDLTRHPNYRYTADADPKNVFDMERYMKKQRAVVKPTDTFDVYEIDATT